MKFVTGLLTGLALGAAGAVYYSVKSDRDLRAMYEEIRSEVDAGNYEALGQRVERGFSDLQAEIEKRVNQVQSGAQSALDQVKDTADDAADTLDEADPNDLGADVDAIADDATDALDSFGGAVEDVAEGATDAASEQVDAWNRDPA